MFEFRLSLFKLHFNLICASCYCLQWKNKYSKLEEKRNALRQAVKLLEQQIDKIQSESNKGTN